MIVDVHIHFLSPMAIEAARRSSARHGVRVLDEASASASSSGTRRRRVPMLEALYTLDRHAAFLEEQSIDTAVFGPLMDVAGYSLPPAQGAAWSRQQNEGLAASLAEADGPVLRPRHCSAAISGACRR